MTFVAELVRLASPVTPNGPQGRQWLEDELANPVYQAAKPSWFDLVSQAVQKWFQSLFSVSGHGVSGIVQVVLILLFVALIVLAFVFFGAPRLNRRTARKEGVLSTTDARSAEEMRRAAEAAARSGNWALAIEERFRALAKGLAERTIVLVSPGTTAQEFASRAASVFPSDRDRLSAAAGAFDTVRYLGRVGSEDGYRRLEALERDLRAAHPAKLQTASALVSGS